MAKLEGGGRNREGGVLHRLGGKGAWWVGVGTSGSDGSMSGGCRRRSRNGERGVAQAASGGGAGGGDQPLSRDLRGARAGRGCVDVACGCRYCSRPGNREHLSSSVQIGQRGPAAG
eukprot:235178-Chlamydomonas_euryale.AAC.12